MSRSLKKGPFIDPKLLKKVEELNRTQKKQVIKTWSRASTISPDFVGHTIGIHNGKKSISKYVRMAPRKVQIVLDLIRGKKVEEALNILHFSPKKASISVEKTIRSAIANVINEEGSNKVNVEEFFVKSALVNEGPVFKRFKPRAMGRATRIRKRTSHIKIIVSD